jgi:hypothetical protein
MSTLQSISRKPPSGGLVFLSTILSTFMFLVVGCDKARSPEMTVPTSDGIEPNQPSTSSLEDRLVGEWRLDRAGTISATKAAAESAGKGHTAAEAALRAYLENKATPEDAAEIRELIAEGTSAEEIMALLNALETAESLEDAAEIMAIPVEDLDLALDVKFDGEEFRTSEGNQVWRYSASEVEDSPGQATVELRGNDDAWTMRINLDENTLTIDANKEFKLGLGITPKEIATLPSPMRLVFKRSTAGISEGEQGGGGQPSTRPGSK